MILCGSFRASRGPLRDLFSDDMNFGKPIFRAVMPRERFKVILRFLRFDDSTTRAERIISDRFAPIRYVFDAINLNLTAAYTPGRYITVDEHLCCYRGRCSFRQNITNKPDKYGLKFWILADSRTFYPIHLEAYSGIYKSISTTPEDITLRLASVLKPGHVLVADNLFSSLSLSKRLQNEHGLSYFGTVRKNRRILPKCVNVIKGMDLYSSTFYFTDNHTLVSYISKRNKNVLILSDIHAKSEISNTPKRKPQVVLDYNRHKSGVDKLDQMVKEYRPYRATRRWPCVVFFDLIAMSTQASWILFCIKHPHDNITKIKDRKKFLYKLGIQLVTHQLFSRRNSPGFRYLSDDIKKTIKLITEDEETNNIPKIIKKSKVASTETILQVSI